MSSTRDAIVQIASRVDSGFLPIPWGSEDKRVPSELVDRELYRAIGLTDANGRGNPPDFRLIHNERYAND
ncbi:hypothetical protein GGP99_001633 [Salinibacter ruber]|uniref:Uncharacterized protein n=1 Tax=Salinibacter ruber TaxID=146919 RepID=A0AAW5P870_9BACT|nr:hypothetical protein [Salinibacter ruber]